MKGVVKKVLSGDTLVLAGGSTAPNVPPPERRLALADVSAPRLLSGPRNPLSGLEEKDEDWAWEAREFLRSLLVGKVVEFDISGSVNGREYGRVTLDGIDVAELLVREGYAKVNAKAKNNDLIQAGNDAQAQGQGMFSSTIPKARRMRNTVGDVFFCENFAKKYLGAQLPGVVEHVRDGSCVKVYFPEEDIFAQVMFSGVLCDGFKRAEGSEEVVAAPFAYEARTYVENRLLHRDIQLRVEGADQFGNLYGSAYHPQGEISLLLLAEGFARLQDHSARLTADSSALRAALKKAQGAKLRKWIGYDEPVASTQSRTKQYYARMVQCFSGDSFSVLEISEDHDPSTLKDPMALIQGEKRVNLASIRAPRMKTRGREGEEWSIDAFEHVKEALASKKIKIVLEYVRNPFSANAGATFDVVPISSDDQGQMHFVSVYYGEKYEQNLNLELISRGLARTVPHRMEEERAENFADLLACEKEAADKKKVGMHRAPGTAPKHRSIDLVGPQNAQRAKTFESAFKRDDKLEGVIEHVFNAGRFRIDIPKQTSSICFILAGVRAPLPSRLLNGVTQPGQSYSAESLALARYHMLYKKVTVKVEACDRGGNFIGSIQLGKDLMNLRVLSQGWAHLDVRGASLSPMGREFEEAQAIAVKNKKGLWQLPENIAEYEERRRTSDLDYQEPAGDSPASGSSPVVVSHINSVTDFYVQPDTADLNEIQSLCQQEQFNVSPFSDSSLPRVEDVVLGEFSGDKEWCRAKILSVDRKSLEVQVQYIDFGNSETLPLEKVLRLPPLLSQVILPACAKPCRLAGAKAVKNLGANPTSKFIDLALDSLCSMTVTKRLPGGVMEVMLYDANELENGGSKQSVNEILLREGQMKLAPIAGSDNAALVAAEKSAKEKREGIWFYGDVGDSDDERGDVGGRTKSAWGPRK